MAEKKYRRRKLNCTDGVYEKIYNLLQDSNFRQKLINCVNDMYKKYLIECNKEDIVTSTISFIYTKDCYDAYNQYKNGNKQPMIDLLEKYIFPEIWERSFDILGIDTFENFIYAQTSKNKFYQKHYTGKHIYKSKGSNYVPIGDFLRNNDFGYSEGYCINTIKIIVLEYQLYVLKRYHKGEAPRKYPEK